MYQIWAKLSTGVKESVSFTTVSIAKSANRLTVMSDKKIFKKTGLLAQG